MHRTNYNSLEISEPKAIESTATSKEIRKELLPLLCYCLVLGYFVLQVLPLTLNIFSDILNLCSFLGVLHRAVSSFSRESCASGFAMIEQRTSDCGAPGWVMYRRRMVFLPQTELLIAFRKCHHYKA